MSESGVIQDHSLAVSAYHMVFLDHNFYFPILENKMKATLQLQGNNTPPKHDKIDINISEKLQDQLHKLLLYHCIIIRL